MTDVDEHKGWYTRRKLPHFDGAGQTQSITIHIADSLPQEVLKRIKEELPGTRAEMEIERISRIQAYLDQGSGSCILRENQCATIVQEALQFLDGQRFDLRAWVVMPNHMHFLAYFGEGQSLPKALHSLKSYTAHELKKLHPELESIWQEEYFDRYIRSEAHYFNALNYIHENPVKAHLCKDKESFRWSSCFASED